MMCIYTYLISLNNALYISPREVYVYQYVPDFLSFIHETSKSHKHHLFLDLHHLFCSIEFTLYSLEIDNGLSLILLHSQLSSCVFSMFPAMLFFCTPQRSSGQSHCHEFASTKASSNGSTTSSGGVATCLAWGGLCCASAIEIVYGAKRGPRNAERQ